MKISRLAVGDRTLAPSQTTFAAACRAGAGPPHRGSAARHARRHADPAHVSRSMPNTSSRLGGRARRPGAGIDLTLDGEQVKVDNPRSFRLKVTAGPHTIGLRWSIASAAPASTRSTRTSARTPTFTNPGGVQNLVITGPFNTTGAGDTPSRRRSSPAGRQPPRRTTVRAHDSHDAGAPCVSRSGDRRRIDTLMEFYRARGARKATSRRASSRRWRASWSRRGSSIASKKSPRRRVRTGLSHQRRRARVASLVLPVEQHPGRRAARCREQGTAARSAGARAAGQAHARRSEGRRRSSRTSPASGSTCASWRTCRPRRRTSTRTCASSFRRETEMLFGAIVREDRSLIDLLDADYTFVDERLARHYGIPNVRAATSGACRCRPTARAAVCSARAAC